ncbi:NAD(P)-dependent dehydrogenase (short-subunit alcohol dehydrogenase family) [Actinoalloteichus hoggarensis]|uniref:Cyclopentanol dehydrogenase n=1 Tax=Actinoalloteichus hoggarensis TaxID=1470176 RepID=A0A221W835_9PSEU|nr:SDR family oxidoreductase [Actinoalloteichus hoggarensis]ASO21689.1 Cyclopentanol dehydrogenase [Actinoalloteichus hoggarensis]MBB5922283.1 NAD(P)-dependent dehydrogenase (short-subunit alcohol dehydrogenase family) [Actinoalloteichus hoggarensis]
MTDFADRVVVVTGGNAGIGRAVAEVLRDRGAAVHILDRDVERPAEGVTAWRADVTDQDEVTAALTGIGDREGRVDVLVNNAGVSLVGTVEDGGLEEWQRLYDVNVLGYVRTIRAALPLLRRGVDAAIVNVSSCTAACGLRRRVAYSATKGAVQSMTRALAADLIAERIRVNAVEPGTVDTPFMAALAASAPDPAARRAGFEARQPTGRMVEPREVGEAVAYLASPWAHSTVGTVLTVDGGLAALRLTEA